MSMGEKDREEQKMSINMESEYTFNLNSLYEAMQIVANKASDDYPIEITAIGRESMPIYAFSVFFNHEPLALVFTKEVASELGAFIYFSFKDTHFKYIIQALSEEQYAVVSQNDYSKLLDTKVSQAATFEPQEITFSQVVDLLTSECLSINEKIKRVLLTVAKAHDADNKLISLFLVGVSKKIGIKKVYSYNSSSNTFSFTAIDEDRFFKMFFRKGSRARQICRYCGLESLYQILSNQTIRLNGLVGMNDKSEYKCAWDSFAKANYSEAEMEEQMNRVYIMSCSPSASRDDLEMWRLYGDDGKGVCLIFDVEEKHQPFILAQIIYDYIRDGKKKLNDKRWSLLKQLSDGLNEIGVPLKLKNQNKWFSLMKSGDYCYEEETRLLYIEPEGDHVSKNWVLTKTNSIINPYVQFELLRKKKDEDLVIPLKLKGIILGPKCPEKEINVKQLDSMLKRDPELRKLDIKVSISEITNYR